MTLADEIEIINSKYKTTSARIRVALMELAQDDGRDPAWKARQRADLMAELRAAHQTARQAIDEWRNDVAKEVHVTRTTEPLGTQAEEMQKLRDQLRVRDLAEGFTTKAEASNKLIPLAVEAIDSGNVREAQILVAAADKAGAFGMGVIHDRLNKLLDVKLPHRAEALAMETEANDLHFGAQLALIQDAKAVGIGISSDGSPGDGSRAAVARASASAKVRAWVKDPEAYSESAVEGMNGQTLGRPEHSTPTS